MEKIIEVPDAIVITHKVYVFLENVITKINKSILGGLRAKIFNCLITDIKTAEYIVENA